jgi:hypothetical protein
MAFLCPPKPLEEPSRKEGSPMFDLLYLAAGLGFFALMGAYARWAGQA